MFNRRQNQRRRSRARRSLCASGAIAALILASGLSMGGCDSDFDEFRAAASPRLEAGVDALFDGLIDGIFAVVEPQTPAESAAP